MPCLKKLRKRWTAWRSDIAKRAAAEHKQRLALAQVATTPQQDNNYAAGT